MVKGVCLTRKIVEVVAVESGMDSILQNKVVEVICKMLHAREEMIATVLKSCKAQMGDHDQIPNVLDAISLDIFAISVHM